MWEPSTRPPYTSWGKTKHTKTNHSFCCSTWIPKKCVNYFLSWNLSLAVSVRYVGHTSAHTVPSTVQVDHTQNYIQTTSFSFPWKHNFTNSHFWHFHHYFRTCPCPLPPPALLHPRHVPLHHLLLLHLLLLQRQNQGHIQEQDTVMLCSSSSKLSKLSDAFYFSDNCHCDWQNDATDITLPCGHIQGYCSWKISKLNSNRYRRDDDHRRWHYVATDISLPLISYCPVILFENEKKNEKLAEMDEKLCNVTWDAVGQIWSFLDVGVLDL